MVVFALKYFTDLKYGWAKLNLGNFTCNCSYIQDIPMCILKAWEDFKKNKYCRIFIDSEGYENEIIISDIGIHAVKYHNFTYYENLIKYFETFKDRVKLLQDLVIDIVSNADEWARWLCLTDPDTECYDKIINEYKRTIIEYADKIGIEYYSNNY